MAPPTEGAFDAVVDRRARAVDEAEIGRPRVDRQAGRRVQRQHLAPGEPAQMGVVEDASVAPREPSADHDLGEGADVTDVRDRHEHHPVGRQTGRRRPQHELGVGEVFEDVGGDDRVVAVLAQCVGPRRRRQVEVMDTIEHRRRLRCGRRVVLDPDHPPAGRDQRGTERAGAATEIEDRLRCRREQRSHIGTRRRVRPGTTGLLLGHQRRVYHLRQRERRYR